MPSRVGFQISARRRSIALDHVPDRLWVIANTALVHIPGLLKPDCDVPVALIGFGDGDPGPAAHSYLFNSRRRAPSQ